MSAANSADGGAAVGDNYYESTTMSKRDYYSLRDKGLPLQPGATPAAAQQASAADKAPPPSGKTKTFTVVMLDGSSQDFQLDVNATGQDLFDETSSFLNLHEKEYFGLSYPDATGLMFWVQNDKKLTKQLSKSSNDMKLELMVKFYPPDPEHLRENLTRYYVALQLRQNLMAEVLPCSFITYVILGSYVVQSEVGDFDSNDPNMTSLAYLNDVPFCPESQRQQELLERVCELHRCHRGMTPEQADLEFLANAKKLAMYGVDMHAVKDAKGSEEFVGVYHGGVVVYSNSLRVSRFSWPKILKVSYKGKVLKMAIRTSAEKESNTSETIVEFKCSSPKLVKRLWRAVVEHHGFFRLKAPEKPAKPLIPGTFKRNWNYTGPTAQQLQDQPYNAYPEAQITQGMRKSFKRKATPTKAKMDEELDDDALNRELRLQQQQQQQQAEADASAYAQVNKGRQRPPPDLRQQRPGRWAMCPADADPFIAASLDGDANSGGCPSGVKDWQGVRANKAVRNGGQWYYETTVGNDDGSSEAVEARIGWSTEAASLQLGSDADGFGFGADPSGRQQQKLSAGLPQQYGVELRPGDVVGAFVDLDAGSVEFSVNGQPLGKAFPLSEKQQEKPLYPAACARDGAAMQWNFGDDPEHPLAYQPPAPWRPVGEAPDAADNPRAWRLNPNDTSGPDLVVSPDQCSAQALNGWQGVRADRGLRGAGGGRYYFEAEPLEEGGLGRVGWTTEDGSLEVGRDASGWGYGADYEGFGLGGGQGKRLHADEIDSYGRPFSKGDVVGCLLDLDAGSMEFSRNGERFGPAYRLEADRLAVDSYFPTVCMRDQTLDLNLGQRPFKHLPGAEWRPVCLASPAATQLSRRMLEAAAVPSVDQKYDMIRENRQQLRQSGFNGSPNVTVHESRTENREVGDPEEEITTYTDEHGNTVRKRVVKQKQKHQVVTSKVVETRGYGPRPGSGTEHLERTLNGQDARPTARRNLVLSDEGEGDDALNSIIYQVTGFKKEETFDENVSNFSMSNRPPAHESEI